MEVDVNDKKIFLTWLVNHVSFSRREVLWILNYLLSHEVILNQVHFVEEAKKTKRGLCIRESLTKGDAMTLYLQDHAYTDSDQIFHEIRLNWKHPLYVECLFQNAWENELYLSVLEDNPHASWNETVSEGIMDDIEQYIAAEVLRRKVEQLYRQIDLSLEDGEKDAFLELTDELNHLLQQQKEQQLLFEQNK